MIVITTTAEFINFDLTAVSAANPKKSSWRKSAFARVARQADDSVLLRSTDGREYLLSFDNTIAGTVVVSSVDGTAPTSNSHLFDLLSGVI